MQHIKETIWTAKQIMEALSVTINDTTLTYGKIQFNSQKVEAGDLFIALSGVRDGHDFVADALQRGASAAIVAKDIDNVDSNKLIRVNDGLKALEKLAEYKKSILKKRSLKNLSSAKIIAITGSVGKTSTKEILNIMLSSYGKVHANNASFNNSLGVPLTLASMPDDTNYLIVEMGMNAKGELSALSKQVEPDIAVITTISEGHLEFFNSVEEIAEAKCEIFEGLTASTGIAIINRDMSVYEHCRQHKHFTKLKKIINFGKNINSDIQFISYEILDDTSTRLVYKINEESIEIMMDYIIPEHLAENFTAAFSVVNSLGLTADLAASSICSFQPVLGRGKIISLPINNQSVQIICDYYNSNPQSLQASLEYVAQLNHSNKIAILGDMGELGKSQILLHKEMAKYIEKSGFSKVFLVGKIMTQIKSVLHSDLFVECHIDAESLSSKIKQHIEGGELVLIKGSRRLKLEKIATCLGIKNVL